MSHVLGTADGESPDLLVPSDVPHAGRWEGYGPTVRGSDEIRGPGHQLHRKLGTFF